MLDHEIILTSTLSLFFCHVLVLILSDWSSQHLLKSPIGAPFIHMSVCRHGQFTYRKFPCEFLAQAQCLQYEFGGCCNGLCETKFIDQSVFQPLRNFEGLA